MSVIIAAHDISGVGRCSLTTALAVLPAMGHTCFPLPTAVLSQQTGLPGYSFLDMTEHLGSYIDGWKGLRIKPDMIYTGFLGSKSQPRVLAGLAREYKDALVVVDPVMGDNGRLYGCFDMAFVQSMSHLVKTAHILVPNATEFNLLCGLGAGDRLPEDPVGLLALAKRIDAPELKFIVITSPYPGDGAYNILLDIKKSELSYIPCKNSGVSYNGTGDLFASILCGFLARGRDMPYAIGKAARFVADCIDDMPPDSDKRYGINYETRLYQLTDRND